MPFGAVCSHQPWSKVLVKILARWYGVLSVACVLSGVRNHIVATGQCHSGRDFSGDCCVFFSVFRYQARAIPVITDIRGRSLRCSGRNGCKQGAIRHQFSMLPPVIAPVASVIIGVVIDGSSSLIWCIGG